MYDWPDAGCTGPAAALDRLAQRTQSTHANFPRLPMPQFSWMDRLRYALDNYFARGTAALIAGLTAVSAAVIVMVGLIVSLLRITPGDGQPVSVGEAVWMSLMRTLDAGTM